MGLEDFPDYAEKMGQGAGSAPRIRFTTCEGPVTYTGQRAVQDILTKARPAGIMLMASNGRHAQGVPGHEAAGRQVPDSWCSRFHYEHRRASRGRRGPGDQLRRSRRPGQRDGGTDCGFRTAAGMDLVVPSVTWAKLRSQAEGARIASAYLWA